MNTLKEYFQPALNKASTKPSKNGQRIKPAVIAPEMEMTITPPLGSSTSTHVRNPFTSRPSSIFPDGDFRNALAESVLDIKADVMVNWLH